MIAAVVIPYFQIRPGILRRALNSVVAQNLPPDTRVEIIVVDDGSPHPARAETASLILSEAYGLTLIEQPNAGVSSARNAALRAVAHDTTFIAFLDSDDIWHPDHLATAIRALGRVRRRRRFPQPTSLTSLPRGEPIAAMTCTNLIARCFSTDRYAAATHIERRRSCTDERWRRI